MKDLVLKKKTELEEHKRRAHLIGEVGCETEIPIEAIEVGKISLLIGHVPATSGKCIAKYFCTPSYYIYFFFLHFVYIFVSLILLLFLF